MEIPLRNRKGEVIANALIDVDDYETVSKYKWCYSNGYARCKVNNKTTLMHHLILGKPPEGMVIDHINGNRIDNCKNNIRFATFQQNSQNRPKIHGGISKYIGVYKRRNEYRAQSCGKVIGTFNSELEAAITYDVYSFITLGKHAKTNNLVTYEEAIQFTVDDIMIYKR